MLKRLTRRVAAKTEACIEDTCCICINNEYLCNKEQLLYHVWMDSSPLLYSPPPFQCQHEGCGRQFTTIYNLQNHAKLHVRPLTEACLVQGCDEKFATKKLLDTHLKHTHGAEAKLYNCPHIGCNKTFYSQYCMGSHKRSHERLSPIVCEFAGCGRTFDKPSRLKAHQRVHTGEREHL